MYLLGDGLYLGERDRHDLLMAGDGKADALSAVKEGSGSLAVGPVT